MGFRVWVDLASDGYFDGYFDGSWGPKSCLARKWLGMPPFPEQGMDGPISFVHPFLIWCHLIYYYFRSLLLIYYNSARFN